MHGPYSHFEKYQLVNNIDRKMILLLFVAGILVASVKAELTMTGCPPNAPNAPEHNRIKLTKLIIPGCTVQPCHIVKGVPFRVEVSARFDYTATTLPYSAYALVGMLPVELQQGDLCGNIKTGNCRDIKPGVELSGWVDQTAPDATPVFEGTLRIIIKDDNKTPQWCGELRVKVVEKGKENAPGFLGG